MRTMLSRPPRRFVPAMILLLVCALACACWIPDAAAQSGERVGTTGPEVAQLKEAARLNGTWVDGLSVSEANLNQLVQCLVGNGIVISNATLTGSPRAFGTFTGGGSIIGFDGGIILSSGDAKLVEGPNVADGITGSWGLPGDADLNGLIPGYQTNDAAILEFDFTCPASTQFSIQYVFASDEYNEYVNSPFNDVFGFFLDGHTPADNLAKVPPTCSDPGLPVAINNVNCGYSVGGPLPGTGLLPNCDCFRNNDLGNGGGAINTEMDGLTQVFGNTVNIAPGTHHLKIAIADAGDYVLDSNVFLRCQSLACVCPDIQGPLESTLAAYCSADSPSCATLKWTAPLDTTQVRDSTETCVPGVQAAAAYDVRWSAAPILTLADFNSANQVDGEPAPATPGTLETFLLCGLPEGDVYFALRSRDASFNPSPIATAQRGCNPVAMCKDVSVQVDESCHGVVTAAMVDSGSYSQQVPPLPLTLTLVPPGPYPLGQTLVTLLVCDSLGCDSCSATVTAVDSLPPHVTVSLSPMVLWPPNHKMVPVRATVGVTDCQSGPVVRLVSATSNEPDEGLGDGDFPNDIQDAAIGTADFDLLLRSERSGLGSGRIYTVCYSATDASGNSATTCAPVFVPHDQSGRAEVVWDGTASNLVIYGTAAAPAGGIVFSSVMWGTGDFQQAPVTETPSFKDHDGDGMEDAVFTLRSADGGELQAARNSVSGVFARWQNGDTWYLANLDPSAVAGLYGDQVPTQLSASVAPNPAVGRADIRYALPKETNVRLSVFDIAGREVARLVNGVMPAGHHQVSWEPSRKNASAIYLYRLQTLEKTVQGRFTVIR